MDERLQRSAQATRTAGADWAVLTSPDAVAYATGHIVPIEAGPSPFAGGPTLAFVSAAGVCGVVAANVEAAAARASRADEVELYEGYAFDHDVDLAANYGQAVAAMAKRLGVGGVLATERGAVPRGLELPGATVGAADIAGPLNRLRATKTAEERRQLRRSAEAASIGQRAFYNALRAGRTELDVFADIRCAIENFAGERVPVTGDFLSGRERTAGFTGWPTDRMIRPGDPVMADLAPRIDGYWGDSCATCMVGDADPDFLRLFRAAKGALDHAIEIMRPGLPISALDRALRERVGADGFSYPHHSGHSVGTSVHEWPRLVPFENAALEPGMILMVEPGAYDPDIGGVRTEWMIEVTSDGCEVLTVFDHEPATAMPVA